MTRYRSLSPESTLQIGRSLAKNLHPGSILILTGSLGSGKTTLAQGIAEGLGIEEALRSPTYTYIIEYEGKVPLYHIDLYRVDEYDFIEELGLRDLLNGEGICLVEWGEKFRDFFPPYSIQITLSILSGGEREISIQRWDL
ncbi:MAG TPA: tRNA (adenosine(37)-N6)-threonylcarbamoyltransferase complex ATPase subunit type 1 TsaE [Spirochaetales bacterium]|nr:tRNA (adenosine(37)-N6)-threonylcarbamoyltransferase complex ATPase subunit type 1 TsaE [Spirochaetales bacterium]